MGENVALGRGLRRDVQHVEHLLRTLAIALLATSAVAWAVGVGLYVRVEAGIWGVAIGNSTRSGIEPLVVIPAVKH